MPFEYFVAQRFSKNEKARFSRPIIRIATISIALGVAVMLISLAVLRGFQGEIKQKVVGFGSHIQVKPFQASNAFENKPLDTRRADFQTISHFDHVVKIQPYAYLGGLVKTDEQIQGILLKGLTSAADTTFFSKNMLEGSYFRFSDSLPSNEVIISSVLASKLKLKLHDKLHVYFFLDNNLRARSLKVAGIYKTGLNSFDEKFIIGDLKQIQRLNKWEPWESEGMEVLVSDFDHLPIVAENIYNQIGYDLTIETIDSLQPALFSWLNLLDTNVVVIFVVMLAVSVVCIISTLLIMIFEKTSEIGILKTLGASNRQIRKIFLIESSFIILKGIFSGALLASVLCLIQSYFKILKLDSQSFLLDYVPVYFKLDALFFVSVGTLAICFIALLLPCLIISNIVPAKTIRFE